MLRRSKPDLSHENPLYQIKQDDRLFAKLVSKETSIANPSFRGVSVAVPFKWETQPGTPKHKLFPDHSSLPPTLTPPPSYYFQNPTSCSSKKHSKAKLLNILFLRMIHLNKGPTQITLMSPSSPSSSSSSASLSLPSSSSKSKGDSKRRRRLLSLGKVFDDDFHVSFPRSFSKSLLCFRSS